MAPQPPVNRDEGQGTCQAGGMSSKHRPGGAGPPALHARLGTRTSHWAPPGPGGCEEPGPSTPFHRAGHRHGLLHAKKLPLGGTSCLETTLGRQGRAAAGLTLRRGRVSAGPGLPLSGDKEHPDRGWGGRRRAEATAQCPPPLHQPGAGSSPHLPVWPQGATLGPGQDPNQLWPRGPCSCLSQRCCLLSPRPSLTSTTCGPAP